MSTTTTAPRLGQLRQDLELSQSELATLLGTTANTISRMERGTFKLSRQMLHAYALLCLCAGHRPEAYDLPAIYIRRKR